MHLVVKSEALGVPFEVLEFDFLLLIYPSIRLFQVDQKLMMDFRLGFLGHSQHCFFHSALLGCDLVALG